MWLRHFRVSFFFVETQKLLIQAIITFSRDFILSPLMTRDIYLKDNKVGFKY